MKQHISLYCREWTVVHSVHTHILSIALITDIPVLLSCEPLEDHLLAVVTHLVVFPVGHSLYRGWP